jgi:hypothetical protein
MEFPFEQPNSPILSSQTVQSLVSATVGSTVAVSAAIASFMPTDTAGLLLMIQNLQLINMYDVISKTPMTSSLAWTNLVWSNGRVFAKRQLLESSSYTNTLESKEILILIVIITVPLLTVHAGICYIKKVKKYGALFFPQLQLIVASLIVIPITKHASILLTSSNQSDIVGGALAITLIVIPVSVYTYYFVYKYIVKEKHACYSDNSWIIVHSASSQWMHAHASIYNNRLGPPTQLKSLYTVNPLTLSLQRYEVQSQTSYWKQHLQIYITPVTLTKRILLTFFLNILTRYPFYQKVCCITLVSLFALLHMTTQLYRSILRHIPDTLRVIAEFHMFLFSLLSLTSKHPQKVCQWVILLMTLLPQLGAVAWSLYNTMFNKQKEHHCKKFVNIVHQAKDRRYKYANRWLWIVHGRTLQNWPKPGEHITRKCQIVLDRIPQF